MIKLSGFSRLAMLFVVACGLSGVQEAQAQSQGFGWEPQDPPLEGYAQLGTGVAVSGRAAAIGAPQYAPPENPDTPQFDPPWLGLVNVYVTDAERSRWTLLTVLHLDDAEPENQEFGKSLAMQGHRLVVAANASLRIYERRQGGYELSDTIVLSDATIGESAAIQFERDVLAVSVIDNSGGSSVRIFRVGHRGRAHWMATLSPPGEPDLFAVGGLSLDADAHTLAVGMMSRSDDTRHRVHVYELRHGTWTRTAVVTAPSLTARGFGGSVALNGRGLVVGASGENQTLEGNSFLWSGAVYVYRRAHRGWIRVQRWASDDIAQPSFGLVGFGSAIVTNGRYFWITAPFEHEQNASTVQNGPASLYRWNGRGLEFVTRASSSLPQGGTDMSRRYVIEGDIYGSIHQIDGAHIVDLTEVVPVDPDGDDDPANCRARH